MGAEGQWGEERSLVAAEHAFWMGDLNYRLNMPDALVSACCYNALTTVRGMLSPVYAHSRAVSESWKLLYSGGMRLVSMVVQNNISAVWFFYEGPVVSRASYEIISIMATPEVLDLLPSQQTIF